MDRLSRSGLIVIMLLGLLLPASVSVPQAAAQDAALRLTEVSAAGLAFDLDIPLPELSEVQVEGQLFQRLSLPGYIAAGAPGQPELLQTGVMLGIPAEGEVELRIHRHHLSKSFLAQHRLNRRSIRIRQLHASPSAAASSFTSLHCMT